MRHTFWIVGWLAALPVLAAPVALKPYLGTFSATAGGQAWRLSLKAQGEQAVGTLSLADSRLPVALAADSDGAVRGVVIFEHPGDAKPVEGRHFYRCDAAPTAGGLRLTVHLEPNPITFDFQRGDTAPPAPLPDGPAPAPLSDIYNGPTTPLRQADGWFETALPAGWSVAGQREAVLILDCGNRPGQVSEGLALLTWGRLDAADLGRGVDELLAAREPELRELLAADGLTLGARRLPPTRCATATGSGAVGEWAASGGDRPLTVWVGALVVRDWHLGVIGVMTDEARPRLLPGLKRVFSGLQAQPPERNVAAEQALVGATFSSSSFFDGGAISTWYEFGAGGRVSRTTSGGGGLGLDLVSSSSEDAGRWEVVGRTVYMVFDDGQQAAELVGDGGRISALRIGRATYQRN